MAINFDEFNSTKNLEEFTSPRPELVPVDIAVIGSLATKVVSSIEDLNENKASQKTQELELTRSLRAEAERVVQAIVFSNLTAPTKPRALSPQVKRAEIAVNEDIVRLYLDEMGKYPLLNKDKEAALAQLMDSAKIARRALAKFNGSETEKRVLLQEETTGIVAREWFIKTNLRLVVGIARRYQNRGLDFADLINEGNIGIMQALNRFDWRKGFKFSTYAQAWIKQNLDRALADKGTTVRLPVHATELARKYWSTHDRLWGKGHRRPTRQEMANEMFLTLEEVAQIEEDSRVQPYSLDEPLNEDGTETGATHADSVPDARVDITGGAERDDLIQAVINVMDNCLEKQEVAVLKLRWNLDGGGIRSLDAAAKLLNVGVRKVRETELRAMQKLEDDGRLRDFITD